MDEAALPGDVGALPPLAPVAAATYTEPVCNGFSCRLATGDAMTTASFKLRAMLSTPNEFFGEAGDET